jgi:putative CocE/NonD family hydrolase
MERIVCTDLPGAGRPARPAPTEPVTSYGLLVPMRDGTLLALDVVRPAAGGAFPVVLIRTCYDKVLQRDLAPGTSQGIPYDHDFVRSLLGGGYALAVQDVRGRFDSDGEWYPYRFEQEDGFDTVEWIAQQAWCDGSIGMTGRSYVAFTQWAAAVGRPRGLKAIVPIAAQPDLFESGFPVFNGVFNLPMADFLVKMGRHSFQVQDFMHNVLRESHDYFSTLPMSELPRAAGTEPQQWWTDMTSHPTRDAYWQALSYSDAIEQVEVPALNISGWYDLTLHGALANYRRLRERGGTEAVRARQRLVIGPWAHWANVSAAEGEVDFGENAVTGLSDYVLRFLDRWVRDRPNGLEDDPPVHLFVMGANEWWAAEDWPLPGTRHVRFWLHSDGGANTADGDGRLSTEEPSAEPPDTYSYDPLDPVRGAWSTANGPVDDRAVGGRDDVLCYTSEPLTEPLDVVGPLSCVLHASSSARDTDWHARLVDVHPGGYAQFLSHGLVRARFRHSYERPALLTPGEVEEYTIDLAGTANRFLPGHRIRLEITSSWFPRFERNLNSGAENTYTDASPVVAEQTIHHDGDRPSYLLLPVV